MFKLKTLLRGVMGLACLVLSVTSANASVINLGFSLDESGSVGTTNFNTTRDALADALAVIPTTGAIEYRIAVTTFASGFTSVIAPTIVTSSNLAALQAQLRATTFNGGGTNTAGAIDNLTSLFSAYSSDLTLFNITTDGSPNSQSAAENSALAAFNSFVDGISFEAVGSGITNATSLARMARIAGLGTSGVAADGVIVNDITAIPNAATTGFVIPVSDFAAYSAAITAKIGQIVTDTGGADPVPSPHIFLLFGLGFVAVFIRTKAKV
ncbi:vWA domain-containing protein [Agaribacter flavus]|uniref:VWA domain-containing protein n=1 Tax=Agaribacter flavus TaxID=1902781 RepID=A0ABV7FPG3_9ALTE